MNTGQTPLPWILSGMLPWLSCGPQPTLRGVASGQSGFLSRSAKSYNVTTTLITAVPDWLQAGIRGVHKYGEHLGFGERLPRRSIHWILTGTLRFVFLEYTDPPKMEKCFLVEDEKLWWGDLSLILNDHVSFPPFQLLKKHFRLGIAETQHGFAPA